MQDKRSKNSESVHVREVLHTLILSCRKETHTELDIIRRIWNSALNASVTANAQPAALKESILLVTVKSSTVAHQLRFQLLDIMEKINIEMGHDRISEIKLKTGTF